LSSAPMVAPLPAAVTDYRAFDSRVGDGSPRGRKKP
jgi:hypothetical protein